MIYNTKEEAKKAFIAAYRWCRRVQEACLLKKVDISVESGFCPANYHEKNIDAWTVTLKIWDSETRSFVLAEWAAYLDQSKFDNGKASVSAYLMGKGIVVK